MTDQKHRYIEFDEYGDIRTIKISSMLRDVFISLIIIGIVLSGVYRIETGVGAILTEVGGQKVPINSVGWHFKVPILTSLDMYSTVNNRIYFPSDLIEIESKWEADKVSGSLGLDIKTSDNKVVDTGGMVQYSITDLVQYGVMNTNPTEQLQKTIDGEFFKVLQSKDVTSDTIINDQGTVENNILMGLKTSNIEQQYGIKFTTVQLIRPTYTKAVLVALAQKQSLITTSEGELISASNKADATLRIAKAEQQKAEMLKTYPTEVLDYMAKIELYKTLQDKQNTIWVIPQGQTFTIQK